MTITHLNPDALHASRAFSPGTVTAAGSRLVFVGGQNGVDREGVVVGDSIGAQTEQAMSNVLAVLAAAGAAPADVAKLTVHVVAGNDVAEAFAGAQSVWGPHPTAVTVLIVAGLADPRFLVEVDAIAAV
jgi:enamine deaminase RidA (YjgF/YER057c/UK114 family)